MEKGQLPGRGEMEKLIPICFPVPIPMRLEAAIEMGTSDICARRNVFGER